MVEIHKPVKRTTRQQYGVLHHRRLRKIVVSLIPGDVIEFHELRSRKKFSISIDDAFRIAVKIAVAARLRQKREAKKGLLH